MAKRKNAVRGAAKASQEAKRARLAEQNPAPVPPARSSQAAHISVLEQEREASVPASPRPLRPQIANMGTLCGSFSNGVWWMLQQERSPIRGGILADDCGLGKTLTTLAFIYKASFLPLVGKFYKPTLILAPAGVVSTWATQLTESFRHVMPFYVFHGFRSQISDPVQKSRTLENMTKLRDMLEKLGLPIRVPSPSSHFFIRCVFSWGSTSCSTCIHTFENPKKKTFT
ncbi:helicase [Aspergillus flavus]|nr:helicase [Aspergillus flavus]